MHFRLIIPLLTLILFAPAIGRAAEPLPIVAYAPPHRLDVIPMESFAELETFIYHGFIPDPDGTIRRNWSREASGWAKQVNEFGEKRQAQLKEIRATYPGIKIWAGFPGTENDYAPICADMEVRERFIGAVVDLCREHGFDGVDFDYEFPKTPEQRADYDAFLIEAARTLHEADLQISIAVHFFNTPGGEALQVIDRVHLMSYSAIELEDLDRRIERLLENGAKKEQLFPGVGFFGLRIIDGKREPVTYADLLKNYDLSPTQNEVDGYKFAGPARLRELVAAMREKGVGGVMIWEIGQDVFDEGSLLTIVKDEAAAK